MKSERKRRILRVKGKILVRVQIFLKWLFIHEPRKVKSKLRFDAFKRWKMSHRQEEFLVAAYVGANAILLRHLRKQKIDPNFVCDRGMTPLLYAIDQGHVETVAILLEYGASVEEQPVDIPIWDREQDRLTKDPLERAVIMGLPSEGIFEIARRRRLHDLNYLESKIFPVIESGSYRNSPFSAVMVELMLRHQDELPPPSPMLQPEQAAEEQIIAEPAEA